MKIQDISLFDAFHFKELAEEAMPNCIFKFFSNLQFLWSLVIGEHKVIIFQKAYFWWLVIVLLFRRENFVFFFQVA